jgi:hypothetical protein
VSVDVGGKRFAAEPQAKTSRNVPTWRNLSLPFGLFKGGVLPPGAQSKS